MITLSSILSSLRWRYAVKKFNPRKHLAKTKLEQLLEAFRLAPSSLGLQPYKIVVVENKKLRQRVYKEACDQEKVVSAPYFLVICTYRTFSQAWIDRFVTLYSREKKLTKEQTAKLKKARRNFIQETSQKDLDSWANNQAFIALGVLLTSAAMAKIDACPMGGFKPKEMDRVLQLKKHNLQSRVLCTLGYRDPNDPAAKQKKFRWAKKDIVIRMK